jgi:hypothetical protein
MRTLAVWLSAGVVGVLLALPSGASAVDPPSQTGPQNISLGLDRVFATDNSKLDIDGIDEERVDVDIAVLDSGVQLDHPDLNIVERTNCTNATWPYSDADFECTDASPTDGDDSVGSNWHGTASAADIAAIDNNIGRVGAAAGARLWAVDIHTDEFFDTTNSPRVLDIEAVIAGVKWVTAHADEIEIAHVAAGCAPEQSTPPQFACSRVDLVDELGQAIEESIDAGVVYIQPAGNWDYSTETVVPPRLVDDLLVVGGMTDTDGRPGYLGPTGSCDGRPDDHGATTNWGPFVDLASPGCATSVASPHATAAAAILASRNNPDTRIDVQTIHDEIVNAGNDDWTDTSGDGVQEPLLDLHDQMLFDPVMVPGTHGSPGGWDYNLKKRCIKTVSASLANYYEDTAQCTAGGRNWTAFVNAENAIPQPGCPGPAGQVFPINGSGSPAIMGWYPHTSDLGANWTVNLKVDNVYTSMPCMGTESLTRVGIADATATGGGPLPNPRSLISSHRMSYAEWRPYGGATRLLAGAVFAWGGKLHHIKVSFNSAGFTDTHPHPDALLVDYPSSTIERIIIDGPAIGRSVPATDTPTFHWIDWKSLVNQAIGEGWFSPMTTNAETQNVYMAVEAKGDALANLWTTDFRIAGKQ